MKEKFLEVNKIIRAAGQILLVTHPSPDGDALGSVCAMIGYLKQLGKNYRAFCADPVPENLVYLPWQEEIQQTWSLWSDFKPELVIFLDLSEQKRSGIQEYLDHLTVRPRLVVIDHHLSASTQADISCIDPGYGATTELLFNFLQSNGIVITKNMADALLIGLLTDTENFTNASARPENLLVAGELMKLGANYDKLTKLARQSKKLDDLRLIGLALSRLIYRPELGLVTTFIKDADQARLQLSHTPLAGFTNFLKGLSHGSAVLLLVESQGQIKGSLRSVDQQVNVAELARLLGGGGHRLAAGFTITGRLEAANAHWQVI